MSGRLSGPADLALHEDAAAEVAQPRVVWNLGDRKRNESPCVLKLHGRVVVSPAVQAHRVEAGLPRAILGPVEQARADAVAAVPLAHGKCVEKHASPILQLEHGPDMASALQRQYSRIFFFQQIGWEYVGHRDDCIRWLIHRHEAIAVRDGIPGARRGNGQEARGSEKWNQVAEQKLVKTAARKRYESSNIPAVGEGRCAVGNGRNCRLGRRGWPIGPGEVGPTARATLGARVCGHLPPPGARSAPLIESQSGKARARKWTNLNRD